MKKAEERASVKSYRFGYLLSGVFLGKVAVWCPGFYCGFCQSGDWRSRARRSPDRLIAAANRRRSDRQFPVRKPPLHTSVTSERSHFLFLTVGDFLK